MSEHDSNAIQRKSLLDTAESELIELSFEQVARVLQWKIKLWFLLISFPTKGDWYHYLDPVKLVDSNR